MPTQDPRDPKAAEQNDSGTEKLEDLQPANLTEQDGSQVKGGDQLNPQPLPPRKSPGVIS